jgi:hypothetical protein
MGFLAINIVLTYHPLTAPDSDCDIFYIYVGMYVQTIYVVQYVIHIEIYALICSLFLVVSDFPFADGHGLFDDETYGSDENLHVVLQQVRGAFLVRAAQTEPGTVR